MKKQSTGMYPAVLYKGLKNLFLLSALLLMGSAIRAQTKTVAIRTAVKNQASVKHLGNVSESVLFQVKYENLTGEKFSVVIKDEDGSVLYQDTYKEKSFDKKFQLPQGQANKIKFIIKAVGEKEAQTFEVNTQTRLVEEVLVNKVS